MYLAGFGNHHQTEAITGALPVDQNSPQKCPHGLYAEQLSGSAFTRSRHLNLHSWLYRKIPSVVHDDYVPYQNDNPLVFARQQAPNPFRWSPLAAPAKTVEFIDGLFHMAGNTQVNAWVYHCSQSMQHRYFCNNDGEMLFVPYSGDIQLFTEFGPLRIGPGKIAVIPRGVVFKVTLNSGKAAGYLCENSGLPLRLPELGFMGSNGLANPRHFLYPAAAFEEGTHPVTVICKYQHRLWSCQSRHSPLNVLAWHGNYAPYCYDLSLFNTLNSVSFDHPDPSIFTVLTSDSNTPGMANLDFVIFPPRWVVAEHTFRPPYFHRNVMSELMGLILGEYDAKKKGFLPGGISIHNAMTAHGPDADICNGITDDALSPVRYDNTLAFMLETSELWNISEAALSHPALQSDYSSCWQGL